jgi:hypothetical protein
MKVTRPTFLQYNDTAKPLTEKQAAKAVKPLKTKVWVGIQPAKFLAGESCSVVGDMWHGYTENGLAKQRKSKSGSECHIYSQYTMQIIDTKTVTLTNNRSSLTVFSFDNKRERDAFLKDTISNCIEAV